MTKELADPKKLQGYLIRPISQDLDQVKRLQEKLISQLAAKKLLGECALENSLVPIKLAQTNMGTPVLYIKCSQEVARLITNLPQIYKLEADQGNHIFI